MPFPVLNSFTNISITLCLSILQILLFQSIVSEYKLYHNLILKENITVISTTISSHVPFTLS